MLTAAFCKLFHEGAIIDTCAYNKYINVYIMYVCMHACKYVCNVMYEGQYFRV